MSQINCTRKGCKDVFNAFLVNNADYEGFLEIPKIEYGVYRPTKLISFSKAIRSNDFECWVHFYEDDIAFERLWRNPQKYFQILNKFAGVICPDFSLYRDMPLVMQFWNIYRSRAIGHWLQKNHINVIPNLRFGDERTTDVTCYGIAKHTAIAIGSYGTLKNKIDRKVFVNGLKSVISRIEPTIIIVYGSAPVSIFDEYRMQGIEIYQFDSEFAISRKGVV